MKKFFKIAAIVFVAITFIFVISRHGWRIFGFSACNSPSSLYAETVSVEDGLVRMKGVIGSSAPAYVGHTYKIEDNNLYIGVKHNTFLGFINRLGNFNITISVDSTNIENVYFKDKDREKLIWDAQQGHVRAIPQVTESTKGVTEDDED
ncbi:hypothetical protein [Alkaliphilus peptidifermentans]|uniref:Uncharacterized protein n=1 Tax=Alkaliphilus peptidifermentans DSM 18978 TaxID=1120976 RepID=A0A1G5GX83_9FIRM|nr:hypothetical protein [Alkaliphilus peptidifermentans]SCY56104.1 hypothetical protein SAMN03080606_01816 [Alkaliphilus peptidifermentans DSM 18978]